MTDLIRRADALEEMAMAECGCSYSICKRDNCDCSYIARIKALPSAEGGDAEMNEVKPQYMQVSPSNGADLISRADAIESIQNAYCKPCKERGDDYNEVMCRACNFDDAMAQIDALPSAEPSLKAIKRQIDEHWYLEPPSDEASQNLAKPNKELKGSDVISRDVVLANIDERLRANGYGNVGLVSELNRLVGYVRNIPSAEAAQGEWIVHEWAEECDGLLISNYECTNCHSWERNNTDFCPNCGARMNKGGDDE